jgi:hypothetical protein
MHFVSANRNFRLWFKSMGSSRAISAFGVIDPAALAIEPHLQLLPGQGKVKQSNFILHESQIY